MTSYACLWARLYVPYENFYNVERENRKKRFQRQGREEVEVKRR